MLKDGRYFLVKLPLRETLEEISAGVFEYAGLNDEHARDICFIISIVILLEVKIILSTYLLRN